MSRSFEYDVCVVGGCGHVGLPLAIMFANTDRKVCVYDINEKSIEGIKGGKLPFYEEGAEPLLASALASGNLDFTSKEEVISKSEIIIVIIGTPVDEHLNPRVDVLKKTFASMSKYISHDQLLILRSTVYPGVTKRVKDWLEEDGHLCDVAFCPERILEGKAVEELTTLPQIVSSFTESGVKRASDLFRLLTDDIVVVDPLEAELTKLCTNVWRYIKFAVSNQFYTIANDYNVDFYRIHHAMTHNYPRCKDFPRPGFAAGPCLFKDTMQLGAFYDNNFNLGHTAMLINEGLPNYVCKCLKREYDLTKLTVGILGMAFKAESDDTRESLSYKVKKLFEFESKLVLCSDPYVEHPSFVSKEELIERSDIIIIATPHKEYKDIVVDSSKKVVDIWNILGNGGKI
jgi:nucleotide sugar dehydrogenase